MTSPDDRAVEARLLAGRAAALRRMPYLASLLYALTLVPTSQVPTLAVDERWRLYWNPRYVGGFTVEMMAGFWLHEAMHLLRDHPARFRELNQPWVRGPLWNIAADATINHGLTRDRVKLPAEAIAMDDIPDGLSTDTAEQLYEKLLSHAPPNLDELLAASTQLVHLPSVDCGSGASPGRRPWEITGAGGVSPAQAEIIRATVTSAIGRYQGYVPSSMRRWAEERLRAQVDWRKELATLIRKEVSTVAGAYDYSYARPSRRSAGVPGVVLPAMRRARPPRIAAVIDTSGSMSNRMLAGCLAEIDGVLRQVGPSGGRGIRLVAADATGHGVQQVRDAADIQLVGGGGTDLREAVVEVATHAERPDLVLILTDGMTPWAAEPPAGNRRARYIVLLMQEYTGALPGWVDRITVRL